MRSVTVEAFAKINLTLRIVGKRADGFHEIRTVLQTVDFSDHIVCTARPGPLRLHCRAKDVPEDKDNLVWRAAEALWRASGRSGELRDLEIVVTKRIPARAGLGGGSSDAAATLVALSRLWNTRLHQQALAEIAGSLGSDVPFFLWGGTALAIGRGEEIYPLADLPRSWALIVTPPFGIATADAYAWSDAADNHEAPTGSADLNGGWLGRLSSIGNDLERAVAHHRPEIAATVAMLRAEGASFAAMSGSGSAVFGLFKDSRCATAARRRLRLGANWKAQVVRLLSRREFVRRARPVLDARRSSRIN